jgi:hypothetical protein
MQQEVDRKQLAGIVTILARHGEVFEERTYGKKDIASGAHGIGGPPTVKSTKDAYITSQGSLICTTRSALTFFNC